MDFAILVGERWLIGLIITAMVVVSLFALDLFLLFKNRDFGFVRTYFLMVELKESGEEINTLQFVAADINVPLKALLRNRFLLWRTLWAAYRLQPGHLVLDLGRQTHDIMELVRYQLGPLNRAGLAKDAANRSAPGSFKVVKCKLLICFVYHSGVLKVWLVHKADLENAGKYLKSKTNQQAQNRKLLFELARAYKENPGQFVTFTLVAG